VASHFTLTLDTQAPANPAILLNSGAAVTGAREVAVALSTADYQAGARDVAQMRLWGDVDPAADPFVQPTEAASVWQTFETDYVVRLSTGSGRKTIHARLKDDVCNESPEFCDFIDLDLDSPVVSITTAVDRARISKVAPCNAALFIWESSRAFVRYEVRVVPSPGSPHIAGVPIGTAHGSTGVVGVGSFPANAPMTTVINGADLEAASPGDTRKTLKVYVQDQNGVWSS
jgi:hypothetical protein